MRQTKLMGIRYRSIADRIERMIADGVYEPGERIASIRQLSELFDASINTIKSALHLLQDRGILNAVPRVGTYVVSRPVAYHESEYVDDLVDAVIEEYGRPPISTAVIQKMDLAVLPQELVPTKLIQLAMHTASSSHSPLLDGFATFERTAELRSRISQREMQHSIAINPDHLVFASSIEQAVSQLLLMLNPTRRPVAVQTPTYYGHLTILQALHMPVLELPTLPDGSFSVPLLAAAVQQNQVGVALLDTAVHNPTGMSIPEARLTELSQLVSEAQLPVIEYGMLRDTLCHAPAPTLYSLAPSGSVFYCSSYAESLSPSIKTAWVAAGSYADRLRDRWRATSCTASALPLAVLEQLLSSRQLRRIHTHNREIVTDSLISSAEVIRDSFPTGTNFTLPDGGFALWIELPRGLSGRSVFRAARKEGIWIAPGLMFGRCPEDYDGWIRIAPGVFDDDKKQVLGRLGGLVSKVRSRSVIR